MSDGVNVGWKHLLRELHLRLLLVHGLLEELLRHLVLLLHLLGNLRCLEAHWHLRVVESWNSLLLDWLANTDFLAAVVVAATATVHSTVPPVLDGIVAAATQTTCDLSPTLTHLSDHLLDENALFGSDGIMVEVRLEVLVETLAALLGRASANGR
jgi:hypothetical protein